MAQRPEIEGLKKAVGDWLAKPAGVRAPEHIYHVLEHEYTEANVSLGALKLQDLAQVQALKHIASSLPVHVFLALLEKEEMGCVGYDPCDLQYGENPWDSEDDYHHIDEVFEQTYRVKALVDLSGKEIVADLPLDEMNLLQPEAFDEREAEEEYDGYMGKSSITLYHKRHHSDALTHWEHCTGNSVGILARTARCA